MHHHIVTNMTIVLVEYTNVGYHYDKLQIYESMNQT